MYTTEIVAHLLAIKSGRTDYKVFDEAINELYKLNKIREITERAVKSQDPINLYKALCINEIANILNIAVEPEKEKEPNEQITIDEIL